jgi:hypothetical protein
LQVLSVRAQVFPARRCDTHDDLFATGLCVTAGVKQRAYHNAIANRNRAVCEITGCVFQLARRPHPAECAVASPAACGSDTHLCPIAPVEREM